MKEESVMDSTDYTGVELRSSLNRSENTEERKERKSGYGLSRVEKYILFNMKEEEGERCVSVKMESEDGVKVEDGLWSEEKNHAERVLSIVSIYTFSQLQLCLSAPASLYIYKKFNISFTPPLSS
ncbi:hypothetical protein AAFF_G00338760, partial [Aldrovandia affinis]